MAAIAACLPGGSRYPEKPLDIFKPADEQEEELPIQISSDDAIREQSMRIDALIAAQKQLPEETIGEKRN